MLPLRGAGPVDGAAASGAPQLAFRWIDEPEPGEQWLAAFAAMWPAYRAW